MKENEIRPKEMWEQYKLLCEKDAVSFFENCKTVSIPCPACNSKNSKRRFEKDDFSYQICNQCLSVFLNPRPLSKYFKRFYTEGESVRFWSTDFYPLVEEQRRRSIYAPRVKAIKEKLKDKNLSNKVKLLDVGCGYGTFLEEVRDGELCKHPIGVEPNCRLANIAEAKGFNVYRKFFEDLDKDKETFDMIIAFEVLEHLYNPRNFIKIALNLLNPNGVLLMTSLSCAGYDFQLLGKDHDNLKPPHHINFFNPDSAKNMFFDCGFKAVEIETPGKLDIDILCNRVQEFPYLIEDKLFKHIFDGSPELKSAFQNFLATNKLSSHIWIWALK